MASIGVQMAMTLITTLLGGDAGPSEMELMEDRLNQRLDEIADQISEVQDQLSEISDQISASTDMIINSVTGAIENETDKNQLRDFVLSTGQGDFSYNELKNAIYGSTEDNRNGMTAYYALLIDAQLRGGSSEDIKHYYDMLYSTLVDNRVTFHDYIIGDGFGKSIVETYYDVISVRPDLTAEMGKSAEMATIEFAYDLYQTEMMMNQLILICNNYQYAQMLINGTDSYNYGTGVVLASDIHNAQKQSNIAKSLQVGIDEVRMQFAEDVIYVMGTTTYYVQYDANGGTGEMANSTYRYDESKQLSPNEFVKSYNVTFDFGWNGQEDTVITQKHIFQYWSKDGKTAVAEDMVYNWTDQAGKVIPVYAIWDVKIITLPTPEDRTGYTFVGWYTDAEFTNLAGATGQASTTFETTGECTLYAKWQANAYTVVYEVNMMGTGNVDSGNADQCYSVPTWQNQSSLDTITYDVVGTYLDLPAAELYDFMGWYTQPVGGVQIADSNGMVIKADALATNNAKLYAHWKPTHSGTYIYDEASLLAMGKEGTYHIVRDITMTTTWDPIDFFKGSLDGHGHTITGLIFEYTSNSNMFGEAESDYGFVRTLVGSIKNVNFDRLTIRVTKYKDDMSDNNVGGVAGKMIPGASMSNVHITNSTIYSDHFREVSSSGKYVNVRVGGFVGLLSGGTMDNCSISGNSSVSGMAGKATSSADAQCFAGGIVGYMLGGTLNNCSRTSYVTVTSLTKVDGKNSASRSAAGGIVGLRDAGVVENTCSSYSTNVSANWENGSYSKNYSWKEAGAIVGKGGLIDQ